MENRRPQLNLVELHQLKWLLGGLLAGISAWTVLYMEVDAWFLLLFVTLAVPAVTARPALVARVPRWAHRLAFPTLLVVFAVDMAVHWREPLPPVIRLALMLVLYRVVTPRSRRDDLQLIVLGLFLVVVGGVLSVSIVFAAQIVVFTACALLFLLAITLADAMEPEPEAAEAPAAAGEIPGWMHVSWRRLARRLRECVDWRVALLGTLLFGGVVGLSAVLFMAIPRFELGNGLFIDRLIARQSKTGFSENIQFGDVVNIQRDTSVALSVDVKPPKVPAELYWRMLVLDDYSSGSFHMSDALRSSLNSGSNQSGRVRNPHYEEKPGLPVWTFYMETGTSRFLPLLGKFSQISLDGGGQDVTFSGELNVVVLRRTPAKMLAYRVEGMMSGPSLRLPEKGAEVDLSMDGGPMTRKAQATFSGLGDMSAREKDQLAAWVGEIGAPLDKPEEFARRASRWLWRHHSYSLQSQIDPGIDDPLIRWIGSKAPGHCELFASAFALLAREAGYPARVVLGFKGGTWNTRSGNITVRNSDAHAWCEIFDRAHGVWWRVDPTPGSVVVGDPAGSSGGEAALALTRDEGWSARFESLRVFWYRRIVNFDRNSQVEMVRHAKKVVGGRLQAFRDALMDRFSALRAWFENPWDTGRVAAWLTAVLVVAGLVLAWKTHGRGAWLRWRSKRAGGIADPVRREAGRWLRRLADAGLESREDEAVCAELERLRYGPRPGWPEPMGVFRRAKRVLAKRKKSVASQVGERR